MLSLALALNLIVNSWVLPNRAVLSAALVVRPQTLSRIVEAVINLGLSVLLGHYIGLIGIILGTAIAGILTSTWYLPLLTARLFDRSWFKFMREDALPILAVGACVIPVAWLMQVAGRQIGGFLGAGVSAGLTALAGFILLWLIALDNGLRNLVVATVAKVTRTCYRSVSVASSQG
jgi:O-antigen/teichoic acid export membrane protein